MLLHTYLCFPAWLLLLLPAHVAMGSKVRIAYVTNAWWPKVDGAAITVMGHARYFASVGHPVLVVRPIYPSDSPLLARALATGITDDDMQPSPLLEFLDYRVTGLRGGGFE